MTTVTGHFKLYIHSHYNNSYYSRVLITITDASLEPVLDSHCLCQSVASQCYSGGGRVSPPLTGPSHARLPVRHPVGQGRGGEGGADRHTLLLLSPVLMAEPADEPPSCPDFLRLSEVARCCFSA